MEFLGNYILIEYLVEVEEVSVNVKSKSARIGDLFFAETIQNCGSILLNKKQTPRVKALKKQALKEVIDYILIQNNSTMSEEQVYKKINNMKARVKAKRSHNAKLNEGEKLFLQLMTSDESNDSTDSDEKYGYGDDGASSSVEHNTQNQPNICKTIHTFCFTELSIRSDIKVGVSDESQSDDDVLQHKSKHIKLSRDNHHSVSEGKFDKRDQYKHQADPGDRSDLNISELKKMVLLKKLDVLNLQKSFYEKAHNMLDLLSKLPQNK